MSKVEIKNQWRVKVYLVEEYQVEAETKEEAIRIVNDEGNPSSVETIKVTAKRDKP